MSEIPKSWLPLIEWDHVYHYDKQRQFVAATRDFWEILFVAGNGTGKTHILYWNLINLALGIHPFQFAEPPLRIKILMHDFEHGYHKIFNETCLQEQNMPELFEVWHEDKRLAFFGMEQKAQDFLDKEQNLEYKLKKREAKTMPPMLKEDPYMITRWPSRDNWTLEYYNGSNFFFQTSEQKKRQHSGTNFDVLACDEESAKPIYDESKRGLRNAKGKGRIYHAFTPPFEEETKNKGPTWTKFELVDPFDEGKTKDIWVIRSAMAENPAITEEFIKRFSRGKTAEQIKIQVFGEYPTWGELIFPEYEDSLWNPELRTGHLLPYDFPVPWDELEGFDIEMALDWHGSKPPAIIWSFEVTCGYWKGLEKGDVVIFDEISPLEGKKFNISKTSDAIREHENWRRIKIKRWADPKLHDTRRDIEIGFSPWDQFRQCGIRLSESWNREPYVGYSIIRDFLRGKTKGFEKHPRLFIKENCRTLRHNMKNHYNVPLGDGTAKPDPKFSDYCVNLKYIMLKKSRKVKKNMDKIASRTKWPLTSIHNAYTGHGRYIEPRVGTRVH